jgi:hypothetical protein
MGEDLLATHASAVAGLAISSYAPCQRVIAGIFFYEERQCA